MSVRAGSHHAHLLDGQYVLAAGLAAGLRAEVFPRQVMTFAHPEAPTREMSFVHGVPESCTLSAVTYAQDKRMSRALVREERLPLVPGATFSFRGIEDAVHYADRTDAYPVTVRMAIIDSADAHESEVRDEAELRATFDRLRQIPDDTGGAATNAERSAYSLTNLLSLELDDEDRKLWSQATRVLVRRRLGGHRLRCLVADGEVVAIVRILDVDGRVTEDVEDRAHRHLRSYAQRAVAAIPGLSLASVDLLVDQPIEHKPERGRYFIDDVVERPRLQAFDAARDGWGRELAGAILHRQAARSELALEPARERIALRVQIEGASRAEATSEALAAAATAAGIVPDLAVHDAVTGELTGSLEGAAASVAALLDRLIATGIDGHRAMFVATEPV